MINRKSLWRGFILIGLFCVGNVGGVLSQVSMEEDFEAYESDIITDFYQFADSVNLDFADFLEQAWQEFVVYEGEEPPLYALGKAMCPVPAGYTLSSYEAKLDTTGALFFGMPLRISFLPDGALSLPGLREKQVADGWRKLVSMNFSLFIKECKGYSKGLGLNEWGDYLLMKSVCDHVYPSFSSSEKTLLLFYVMINFGYRVKIGRGGNESLVLLLPFKEGVFRIPYIRVDGVKYFVMDAGCAGLKNLYTFRAEYPVERRTLSLSIRTPIQFPAAIIARTFSGKNAFKVELNKHLIDFYASYPLCDLSVYFQAVSSDGFKNSLDQYIGKRLEGKSSLLRIAWLLDFAQRLFVHKPDKDVHKKEVYYFPEEICYYPYADCEDFSVFLSSLLRLYTNQKVLTLYYPSHVAVAVENCGYKGNVFMYEDKEYIICDPSYKGGGLGKVIPACAGMKPVVVSYFK